MAYKVKWYGKEVISTVEEGAMTAVKKACFMVERDAKKLCPVDTGRLRSSISSNWTGSGLEWGKVETKVKAKTKKGRPSKPIKAKDGVGQPTKKLTGVVGSNVEYARKVEMGDEDPAFRRAPQPYLRPAIHKNEKKILAMFKNII